jgi:hypothetical protein
MKAARTESHAFGPPFEGGGGNLSSTLLTTPLSSLRVPSGMSDAGRCLWWNQGVKGNRNVGSEGVRVDARAAATWESEPEVISRRSRIYIKDRVRGFLLRVLAGEIMF